MRPLSGRRAAGGFKITTLGRGGLASRVLRASLAMSAGRHSRRAPVAGMPIQWACPPCSSWHPDPHLGGCSWRMAPPPAYVTDGDSRARMRRARSADLAGIDRLGTDRRLRTEQVVLRIDDLPGRPEVDRSWLICL
jgi:hypothetical protein